MRTPTTEIDARFSEPGATPTPWEQTLRALEEAQLFWITTVRADGRPHVTPLVAVWSEDALHFCTGATEQKARNLQGNANVILTTGCNGWEHGLDVVVQGAASRTTDERTLRRLADAWRTKWNGEWDYEVVDGAFRHQGAEAHVFTVVPTKVLAFGKGPFANTRHRF